MKIITITLNPSLDKTIYVPRLDVGELNRVDSTFEDAAGKGINISKNCMMWGYDSVALGFIGGYIGQRMKHLLKLEKINTDFVEVEGNTRSNIKVKTNDGSLTEINEPGPLISETNLNELFEKIKQHVTKECVVVISGSAPPSIKPIMYRQLITLAKELGAYVILDADKQALKEGLLAIPHMIKPNEKEVQWFVNSKTPLSEKQLIRQALDWIDQGLQQIVISQGARGALFVNKDHIYKAEGLSVNLASPIGAGDAMVAAMIYAHIKGWDFKESCMFAISASAATVETSSTQPVQLSKIEEKLKQVQMKEVNL